MGNMPSNSSVPPISVSSITIVPYLKSVLEQRAKVIGVIGTVASTTCKSMSVERV